MKALLTLRSPMTAIPRPLDFEILVGCAWIAALPQHVRAGDVFRMLRRDGSVYLAASRVLSDVDDAGVYVAAANGSEAGVPFEVVQAVTVLVAPPLDLGE